MPAALSDFTPFGYLRNPAHRATSWTSTSGGVLRSAPDRLGVEWAYPVGRDPTTRIGLNIETVVDGRPCATRADFDALGVTSRHHSCLILGFDWQLDGVRVAARYFLADPDALCALVTVSNDAHAPRHQRLRMTGSVDSIGAPGSLTSGSGDGLLADSPCPHVVVGARDEEIVLGPHEERRFLAVLARGADGRQARQRVGRAAEVALNVLDRLLAEDERFEAASPTLTGDWPAHWREGLHHDFQTTRLLVQPAGGVFGDVWPSWMAAWPRVVMAEGTLDMLRLAYVEPELACRAVLSMFRDAPAPNVPCIFTAGEPNMLAADGSACGTSPAWCLPFLSLELLYLRTLDRHWLAELFPMLAAYLGWWLEHRVDSDGWMVYTCTWESGEDGNPRLDPTGSGDAVISGRVRPVELQATVAHAAGVLAFFAAELGRTAEIARWRSVEADFGGRTRRLFDASEGRYRDWLIGERRFAEPCPDQPYWNVDAGRYSAQSLTPLLIGEPLPAAEVWRHATAPWTLWPSWTLSLVESAAAAGLYAGVGELAFQTIDRVYRVTTRRELGSLARPMPGAAPEFWPRDWQTYTGNDAYGWGATTANLLIRHLFGLKESRRTSAWAAELTPALPRVMLEPGARYAVDGLGYRGLRFDLAYTVQPDASTLLTQLVLHGEPRACRVERIGAPPAEAVYPRNGLPAPPSRFHEFQLEPGSRYSLQLSHGPPGASD